MAEGRYIIECPHCGDVFSGGVHDCDELPPTAGGQCPLCNEPMDSWLNHMKNCSARGDG